MNGLSQRKGINLIGLYSVKKSACRVCTIGVLISQGAGTARGVPLLTRGNAGVAANADVKVNDERELFGLGHGVK